ncbi:MAG: hypothetical protein K8S21_04765 [Gemmatimonadetes bacterium]|nr:hypothetical protein [Gemmatimonadota bacterium]
MRTRSILRLALAALLFGGAGAAAGAQEPGPPPPLLQGAERDSLEARVRQRMAEVVRRQLGLNNEQMKKLGETNRRFDVQRRELLTRERDVRMDLRDEMESGDTTRQAQVARLLDQMLAVQRQRFEQLEAEQRELGTFLTPIQRAKYFAMEEQIRRRVMEMREDGMRAPPGGGARRPGGIAPGGRPGGIGGTQPGGRPGAATPRGGVRRPLGRA